MTVNNGFRSAQFATGMGRRPGSLHFHVDCGDASGNEEFLLDLARHFAALGWPSKLTRISKAIAGPHSRDPIFESDYMEHTPDILSKENTFSAYSTTIMRKECSDQKEVMVAYDYALPELRNLFAGHKDNSTAFEIERVSCEIKNGSTVLAKPIVMDFQNVIRKFEIHHFVDLHVNHDGSNSIWEFFCRNSPVEVGGWFLFSKEETQSFRSVKFSNDMNVSGVFAEHSMLRDFCKSNFAQYIPDVSCIIEQILLVQNVAAFCNSSP